MCWSISIAYNNTKTQPWCVDEENPSHPCCVQFIQTVDCSSFCSRVYHFQQSWWGYTTTNFQFFVFMKKNCLAIACKKKKKPKKQIYWNLHILMSCFDERDRFLTFFFCFVAICLSWTLAVRVCGTDYSRQGKVFTVEGVSIKNTRKVQCYAYYDAGNSQHSMLTHKQWIIFENGVKVLYKCTWHTLIYWRITWSFFSLFILLAQSLIYTIWHH